MKITDLVVTPVAIADPPLLNAVGVHQPYALRSIIEIHTDQGISGLGETYGDANMVADLDAAREVLRGHDAFQLHAIESELTGRGTGSGEILSLAPGSMSRQADARLFAAIEVALLDIQGKALGRPVVDLLGGRSRDHVPFAAYLFFKFSEHIDFDGYPADEFGEVLTPDALIAEAKELVARHGFQSLKLKGGVLPPEDEIATVRGLRAAFPDHPIRIDPNGAWSVETSQRVASKLNGTLQYLEDPTVGLEGMAEVARDTPVPLATNMIAIGFEDLPAITSAGACRIVLADHHYWGGLQRSRELHRICETWGLELGMHSNSHLGISLAAMVHFGAAVPTMPYAYDTHQPWQTDDVLVGGKLPLLDGAVQVPDGPGLGIELDRDAMARLHERYLSCGIRERDDIAQMRRYRPDWTGTTPRY